MISAALGFFVMTASPQLPCEAGRLEGPAPAPYKTQFGRSIDTDNSTLVLGLPGGDQPGAIGIYESIGATWNLVASVQASDSGGVQDELGFSVSIDDSTLVAGATWKGILNAQGAAYVFDKQPDGTWQETAILPAPPGAWAAGWDVAIRGDRLIVGAKGASALGPGTGQVLVYDHNGTSWDLVQTLEAPSEYAKAGNGFGASVDLEGSWLAVGCPMGWTAAWPTLESVFLYEADPITGLFELKQTLTSSLDELDRFGWSVDFDGDSLAVGSTGHYSGDPPVYTGAVYLYERVGSNWQLTDFVTPHDGELWNEFGASIALVDDVLAVGAWGLDSATGAAYVFERAGGAWTEVAKLIPSTVNEGDVFGYDLAFDGTDLIVGAPSIGAANQGDPGQVVFYSFEEGPHLLGIGAEVSVSAGGEQLLEIGACADHAGDLYAVAGTATGTSPGFAISGQSVPLNPDAYFFHTVNHVGAAPLSASFGTLNDQGRATASFSLPPASQPSLVGVQLDHAYAVLDFATLQVEAVSNAASVSLTP